MTPQETIQKVTEIAQSNGWSIKVENGNQSKNIFEFQRYTNFGQEFTFNVEMQNGDSDTLIESMKRYYEDLDPDYEAYLWIGSDGHGKNGAPYYIKEIVSAMEEVEERIYELMSAFELEFL